MIDHVCSSCLLICVYLLPAWTTLYFCLCLSVGRVTEKSCCWILMKFFGSVGCVTRHNWLDLGSRSGCGKFINGLLPFLIFGSAELYLIRFSGLGRGLAPCGPRVCKNCPAPFPGRMSPRAGFGVVRMDPLRFLAGCRTRRLNQA